VRRQKRKENPKSKTAKSGLDFRKKAPAWECFTAKDSRLVLSRAKGVRTRGWGITTRMQLEPRVSAKRITAQNQKRGRDSIRDRIQKKNKKTTTKKHKKNKTTTILDAHPMRQKNADRACFRAYGSLLPRQCHFHYATEVNSRTEDRLSSRQ